MGFFAEYLLARTFFAWLGHVLSPAERYRRLMRRDGAERARLARIYREAVADADRRR